MKDFKRHISVILIMLIGTLYAEGQMTQTDDLSPFQLKRFGQHAQRNGDIFTAIHYFELYRSRKTSNIKVNYTLAELHRKVRNYEQAKYLYSEIIRKNAKKFPMAQFYYAQMLKSTGNYIEAAEQFKTFKRSYRGFKDSRNVGKLVRYELAGCDSALKIINNPINVTVQTLNSSVNSPHIELSPIPIDNNMFVYASLRVDSLIYFSAANDTAIPVRQFYYAEKEGMDWNGKGLLPGAINIPGVETGNGALSFDGNRFYFTRCFENWQGKMICGIYVSHKKKGAWQEPVKLPPHINEPNYTATQPAIGRTAKRDREVIYFVSDREGGKGGMDIWYTVWDDEKDRYSKVRNLGSKVNTFSDEMTPFYDMGTRNLYFSSTGLPGIGGYDIFKTFGEKNRWTVSQNIGYPINTSFDDLYFTVGNTGEYGFLVSNRPDSLSDQTCCDDILSYRWNNFIRITVTGKIYPFEQDRFGRKRDLSNFDFYNPDESISPMDGATIALYVKEDESGEYVFMNRYTTAEDGVFYFTLQPDREYEFKMEGLGYFDSKNYMSTEFFNFSDTIGMPPIWVNVLTDKPIVLENIYYDFNSAELSQRAKNVLDTTLLVLLEEAPEFIIEIGSHTDSIGDGQTNLELSQERASNVVSYLISKGIPTERLVAKGYGALQPKAPNYLPDGSDNPEGREKNRRTEFRILGTIDDLEEDEEFE